MQIQTLKRTLIGVLAAGLLVAGYARYGESITAAHAVAPTTPAVAASAASTAATAPAAPDAFVRPDMSAIVAQYGPAVVNISVTGTVKTAGRSGADANPFPQLDPDDPFYPFFRHFQVPGQPSETPVRGMGSGFIVRADGVILTNAHVVADADEVTVKLTDRREFKAKVLGIDKTSDVAVVKIDAENLPTVRFGDPSRVRVGEWVLAIGSPFGFENSASAGIVSAKSRALPDEGYVPFLQTDVAVNPGNSGGPLFNMQGEVIGINSQIYSRSGGYQGISFAIPIDLARQVEEQLVANGKVERGRIGVGIQAVNQSLADSFGLDKPAGALVSSVEPGSPAARAGLKSGDIILAFNGRAIDAANELPPLVAKLKPGSKASVRLWRQGKSRDIELTLGRVDEVADAAAANGSARQEKLGLAVRPLSRDEQRQAGVSGGLEVEEVAAAAARAGIQPGDIVLALNGEPVSDVAGLRALAAKAGQHVALLIQRGEVRLFVPIELG